MAAPYVLPVCRPLHLCLRKPSLRRWPFRLRGVRGTHQEVETARGGRKSRIAVQTKERRGDWRERGRERKILQERQRVESIREREGRKEERRRRDSVKSERERERERFSLHAHPTQNRQGSDSPSIELEGAHVRGDYDTVSEKSLQTWTLECLSLEEAVLEKTGIKIIVVTARRV